VVELVIIGIFLIMMGIFLLLVSFIRAGGEGRAEAGGVVIIGPVPIVFGTSQRIAATVMVLAIALTVVALLLFLLGSALVR
jgi:uncharacterized protein (TIGR00304 family)